MVVKDTEMDESLQQPALPLPSAATEICTVLQSQDCPSGPALPQSTPPGSLQLIAAARRVDSKCLSKRQQQPTTTMLQVDTPDAQPQARQPQTVRSQVGLAPPCLRVAEVVSASEVVSQERILGAFLSRAILSLMGCCRVSDRPPDTLWAWTSSDPAADGAADEQGTAAPDVQGSSIPWDSGREALKLLTGAGASKRIAPLQKQLQACLGPVAMTGAAVCVR